MLKIKDSVDLKELEKFGYSISHVSVTPKYMVKQVDDEYVIHIGIEEPLKNMWTGRDFHDSRILILNHCTLIQPHSKRKILIEPEIQEHLYYEVDYGSYADEKIEPYIQDLFEAGLIEKVEDKE